MDYRPSQLPLVQACPNAQRLIRHIARPQMLSEDELANVARHLFGCPKCADLSRALYEVARQFHQEQATADDCQVPQASSMTTEMAIADFWRRVQAKRTQEKSAPRRHLVFRIGKAAAAMAACLALVIVCARLVSGHLKSGYPVARQGFAELATANERQALVLGQPVTTTDQRQEILLGGMRRVVMNQNAELWAMSQNLWRHPNLVDPDTLAYAIWRDEQRDWCLRLYPWVPKAQAALAGINIQADWIEVLMVSGDIWQFHYDPQQSSSQPLTCFEPTAIARLARHYGMDEHRLACAVGSPAAMPTAMLPTQGSSPAQEYANALRRWHEAIASERQDKLQNNGGLQLFSLSASSYLANTRTAAYLWARAHSQAAKQLLTHSTDGTILPMDQIIVGEQGYLNQLRQQTVAARSCEREAMVWLVMPTGNGCQPQRVGHQRKLATLVAELLPVSSDRRQGAKHIE